mgnify:CR=1 FL=1
MWRYVAFDESNHGFDKIKYAHLPEICVALNTSDQDETKKRSMQFPKLRQKIGFIEQDKHDYSYLLFSESDRVVIPDNQKLGIVLGSLVKGKPVKHFLDYFVDGVWEEWDKSFARDIISNVCRIDKTAVKIHDGKDLDKKIKIVNCADIRAYWLLTTKTIEDLKKDPRRKQLLLDYIK